MTSYQVPSDTTCSVDASVLRTQVPAIESPALAKAATLLENVRTTPMLRGRFDERKRVLRGLIETTLAEEGVLPRLATRMSLQLVLKFAARELGDQTTWRAVGQQLRRETEYLKETVGLVERQIVVGLPKLSAAQIESFLGDLNSKDPAIARTILNVALDAAEPLSAGRRYAAEYRRVARQLKAVDPHIARTLANATFMARVPREKAMDHFKHFADLFLKFRENVGFARTVAKAAFRAPDPVKAANDFVGTYNAVVSELTSEGVEADIARTIAGIASLGSDPMPTAHKLLKNFEAVVTLVKRTHPWVARTIALSACRAADPLATARSYMKNYDDIVQMVGRTDPRRAREIATQAFRSNDPLRWAKRYLRERQRARAEAPDRCADRGSSRATDCSARLKDADDAPLSIAHRSVREHQFTYSVTGRR